MGRCAVNMKKWGIKDHDKCECGAVQDMKHLLRCPNLNISCTEEDLLSANENAIQVAKHWGYNYHLIGNFDGLNTLSKYVSK